MAGVPYPHLRSAGSTVSVLTRSSLCFGTLVTITVYALVTIASLLHHAHQIVYLEDLSTLTVLEVNELLQVKGGQQTLPLELPQELELPPATDMGSVLGSVILQKDETTYIPVHHTRNRNNVSKDEDEFLSKEDETAGYSFLSSCLMVMDDNHRLVEWISYHYFVMNLRYLVVHADPLSLSTPKPILDRWRSSEYNMTIVEWSEQDFMGPKQQKALRSALKEKRGPVEKAQKKHNVRQNTFYRQCALHMKENRRKWVSFHDVDEYYVINSDLVKDSDRRMRELGGGLTLLTQQVQQSRSSHAEESIRKAQSSNSTLNVNDHHYSGPCITAYRTQYGAKKSSKTEEASKRHVPEFLDALRFETLRWRHHEPHTHPQDGKSLLDVSKIDVAVLQSEDSFTRPHELLPTCPNIFYHPSAFLRINHYIGSWSYYSFRQNDERQGARKNRRKWEEESAVHGGKSGDEIRPWIQGFVNLMGQEKAKSLLEGVGLDPTYKAPVSESWMRHDDVLRRRKAQQEKYDNANQGGGGAAIK